MHYTKTHEWVKVVNSIATVGISDFAQEELGDIVYIELPKVGSKVEIGKEIVVLESTKAAADVYAPISGTIEEVNTELQNQPELINEDAEHKGWIVRIRMKHPEELDALMDESKYEEYIDKK